MVFPDLFKEQMGGSFSIDGGMYRNEVRTLGYTVCKGNLTDLRRILHLSLAKGNPK
jgi:hypothetical protein